MMRIMIMKSANNEEEQKYDKENIPHDKIGMKELVMPWVNMDRIVCADSYFASVPADEELWKHGIRFIGVIKTET